MLRCTTLIVTINKTNKNMAEDQEHAQEATVDKAIAMADEEEGVVEHSTLEDDTAEGAIINDDENSTKRNLNSYYGNRLGILQSLSLLLNAGLMVYAHVGLSAVILSSQPPLEQQTRQLLTVVSPVQLLMGRRLQNTTEESTLCNEQDYEIWQSGGQANASINSNFCAREYNGGCFLNVECLEECFQTVHGYSADCSSCFAAVPGCSVENGCAFICAADSLGAECRDCIAPCNDQQDDCLNFARFSNGADPTPTPSPTTDPSNNATGALGDSCTEVNLDEIDEWYVVYELTFVDSIKKAWNGDARFLAVIVVLFSGIWPYAKNVILMFAWYLPMTVETRHSVLLWLSRLSKYTLVDVFAVVTILVGVLLQLDVGGTQVAIRGEPRPSIIAFFVATLWEFAQIEWTLRLHNKHVTFVPSESQKESSDPSSLLGAMRFRTQVHSNEDCIPASRPRGIRIWVAFLLLATLATYLSGAIVELIRFTTFSPGDVVGCIRSYNLVAFGNAMVSDLALTDNSAKPGTWTLYIAYVLLVLCFPIAVHTLQVITLVLRIKNEKLCHLAGWIWGFSSVEVLLIGVFSVENSFEKFVASLAGNENAQFFTITSGLGTGFYILIGYSIAAGLLQYFVQCAVSEYYKIDPYHKVNWIWTKLLGCCVNR